HPRERAAPGLDLGKLRFGLHGEPRRCDRLELGHARLDGDVGSDPADGENAGHELGIARPDRLRVGEAHAATIYRRTTTTRVAATPVPPALVARTVMPACARRPAFSKRARPEGTRSVSVLDPAASRVADVRTRRNARRPILTLPVATSEHGRSHVA